MLDLLNHAYLDTYRRIENIFFDKDDQHSTVIVSLYASIIELTDNTLYLLNSGRMTAVKIILRSILDAHIDIINLISDPHYLDQMQASYHKESLKPLKAGLTGENSYAEAHLNQKIFGNAAAYHREQLACYKKRGVEPMNVFKRFEKAGKQALYPLVYNALSAESHNNLKALSARHVRIDGDKAEMVIFRTPEFGDLTEPLFSLADSYLHSGYLVHEHFGSSGTDACAYYNDQLVKLGKENME